MAVKLDPNAIILSNGWKSVTESGANTSPITVVVLSGVAYIDGIIAHGTPNQIIGYLPQKHLPDRNILIQSVADLINLI